MKHFGFRSARRCQKLINKRTAPTLTSPYDHFSLRHLASEKSFCTFAHAVSNTVYLLGDAVLEMMLDLTRQFWALPEGIIENFFCGLQVETMRELPEGKHNNKTSFYKD